MILTLAKKLLEPLGCSYAFYFRPAGGEPTCLANAERFRSASLIKIPILLAWLELERAGLVERGELCDLDGEAQVQGTGFGWKLRTRSLPYQDVLLMMMATSDNLCANLVIQRAGMAQLNATFRDGLGLQETVLERKLMDFKARQGGLDNWMGVQDCIRLYDLVAGLPAEERAWVDGVLLANTHDLLLKRNLPGAGVHFCHKTGSAPGVLHDWGYTAQKQIFLLLNEVKDELPAYEVFGKLGELLL
jgi:beta-lactamase class A